MRGGGEYITIGNFNDDVNTDTATQYPNTSSSKIAYYLIDDVSITECAPDGVNEFEKKYFFNLYPNPNNCTMTLNYEIGSNDNGMIVIYDFTGRKLMEEKLMPNETSMTITNNSLVNGMYLYSVILNNQIVQTDKIVIIK